MIIFCVAKCQPAAEPKNDFYATCEFPAKSNNVQMKLQTKDEL